ncbi:MAG: hypothetical protein QF546_05225, partial [Alphaproteobacteria bacterium]|nr:hypothetical protein [Alphaproteobacteria bacterium]
MKQSPPLFLRLTLTLMAIIGAAGVCYLLFNADKYLASGGRWLALGGGTVLATVVIGLGFRWRELAAYLVLTSVLLPVGLYGAEMILRFVLSPTVVADLGADETSRAAAMIRSAEASGDRLRPDVGGLKPALFSRDAAGRLRSRLSARGTEAIKLGGLSNTLTLTYDPVARDWNKFTTD